MKDFTIEKYQLLLNTFSEKGYAFQTFAEFLQNPISKGIILRQDVDKKPFHSLRFAEIQHELGIRSTFYFRIKPCSFQPEVISRIQSLGHEIGYHYENLADSKGDLEQAVADFEKALKKLRQHAEIKTICMHGSPLSRYDNRRMWEKRDFTRYGILGEPYSHYKSGYYLTDTGRSWNGDRFSIRDKSMIEEKTGTGPVFRYTQEIIDAVRNGDFPENAMLTFHPQRWNSEFFPWLLEKISQTAKNQIKRLIVRRRKSKPF